MVEEVIELVVPGGAWLAAGVALGAALGSRLRPVAKGALKAGMAAGERVQELGAEAVEQAQDLIAEARHERKVEAAARLETESRAESAETQDPPSPRGRSRRQATGAAPDGGEDR